MNAPQPTSPATAPPQPAPAPPAAAQRVPTPNLIATILGSSQKTSDLIFSPGRPPQAKANGQLVPFKIQGVGMLTPDDTAQIAADLIGKNALAWQKLKEEGSCDISYSLPKVARFRVNVFTQRGTCAIVMRVIPSSVPSFAELNLPPQLAEACNLRNGIVLVTGPTGSGKSSTLAAILNKINEEKAYHIITIEDPIEFLHTHKRGTVHQRELHSDTPSFAMALRAALRQAPEVILVGEMRDKETIEVALEAADTGHLVFSTLHTTDAAKTVERIVGVFPLSDQTAVRNRLAKAFRYIVSQRLIPQARRQRPACRFRNPEIHDADARIHRARRDRGEIAARRDARRRFRRYAVLRRRNRKGGPRRSDRPRSRALLRHEPRQPETSACRLSRIAKDGE